MTNIVVPTVKCQTKNTEFNFPIEYAGAAIATIAGIALVVFLLKRK